MSYPMQLYESVFWHYHQLLEEAEADRLVALLPRRAPPGQLRLPRVVRVRIAKGLFALASWQVELRRRMLASRGREQGRWARLVELSYDTLGYLEQNVSPRLALETFLLECRKAS